jgi:hypothetical protein
MSLLQHLDNTLFSSFYNDVMCFEIELFNYLELMYDPLYEEFEKDVTLYYKILGYNDDRKVCIDVNKRGIYTLNEYLCLDFNTFNNWITNADPHLRK